MPQLPGMQVMQALVGCQKRWINSLTRRFHSVDMMYFPINVVDKAGAIMEIIGAASRPFNQLAVFIEDTANPRAVEAGHQRKMVK